MRILYIVPSYKPAFIYGGPIMSVSKLCEELSATSATSVTVITTNANGKENLPVPLGVETRVDGVPVIYFRRITGDPHHVSPSLWRYLYSHAREYDSIHIHSWWNLLSVVSALICVVKHKKFIISPRGMLSDYIFTTGNNRQKKLLHKTVGKFLLAKSSFHATSDQEYAECKALIRDWAGFNIPNIISLPQIKVAKPNNTVFTIGFLSRIDPKKGLPFVFKAISKLNFPVLLKIAGEGEEIYINELKQLAAQLGIEDFIEWIGWKGHEDKFYELMNFDLFILSSFNENFANAVIEALYMGTPVCISRYVGLASFVEKWELGWVCDLTEAAVERAIEDAYFNVSKRKEIEANARGIVASQFSAPVVIQQYIEMYKSVQKM